MKFHFSFARSILKRLLRWIVLVRGLIKSLSIQGVEVLDINLYDLAIELLKAREIWEQILALEETVPKEQLKELLQGVLDPEAHVVPAIAQKNHR